MELYATLAALVILGLLLTFLDFLRLRKLYFTEREYEEILEGLSKDDFVFIKAYADTKSKLDLGFYVWVVYTLIWVGAAIAYAIWIFK